MIDKATVEKINSVADIVEVVSDYVTLTRKGVNYMGLCPFHNERTPSFSVNKARNFCYCFSCHKGGSPVNFIMQKEGISYHDALLQLARKYGIKVEERKLTDSEREAQSKREAMFVANEWAMQYFENNLHNTEEGREIGLNYFYHRGVTEEAIRQFHLGYAIDRGDDFYKAAEKKGFNLDILKELGLIGTNSQGHNYDKYRGRVIFPIFNSSGKVIGFGGRDLKNSSGVAKYINSPESEIYKKNSELYGLFQAKNTIAKNDKCYLVEGYLDVIGMWQSGLKNVVASSGTSLTDGQISLIHRFTDNITLIYDGDNAGIKASLRGIDMMLSHNLDIQIVLLPEGEDPDSWAKKLTPAEFQDYISSNETDMIRFKTSVLMKESADNPKQRKDAINNIVASLANIPDKIKRDIYIQECCRLININEKTVTEAVANLRAEILIQERKKRESRALETSLSSGKLSETNKGANEIRLNDPEGSNDNINLSDNKLTIEYNSHKNSIDNAGFSVQSSKDYIKELEWKVLELCIKSGFVTIVENIEEGKENYNLTTIELVAEELELDSINFSDPVFQEVFDELKNIVVKYREDLENFKIENRELIQQKLNEGYRLIGEKDLSLAEIKIEEKKLEESIAEMETKQLEEFALDYPFKVLASHENDKIRELSNIALTEKHKLSNLYLKLGKTPEENNKVLKLVLNALNVWKNGILDKELSGLLEQLKDPETIKDKEKSSELQNRIAKILFIRNRMAKDLGERIICPQR